MDFKNKLFIIFVIVALKFSAQPPLIKVYRDGKEVAKTTRNLQVQAKAGKKYYSILTEKKEIVLHKDLLLQDIEMFRVIAGKDTAVFTVGKIFEDMKNQRGKNKLDELYVLFNELKSWDVHFDTFNYFFTNEMDSNGIVNRYTKLTYKQYRVFALKTSTYKYYLVPPKKAELPKA